MPVIFYQVVCILLSIIMLAFLQREFDRARAERARVAEFESTIASLVSQLSEQTDKAITLQVAMDTVREAAVTSGLVDEEEAKLPARIFATLIEERMAEVRSLYDRLSARLDHYARVFLPSVIGERDRWHDLYIDALTTYGNAQHMWESALEVAYRALSRKKPENITKMAQSLAEQREKGLAMRKSDIHAPEEAPSPPIPHHGIPASSRRA